MKNTSPRTRGRLGSVLLAAGLLLPLLPAQPARADNPKAAPAGTQPAAEAPAEPGWLDGLLYNPAERTRKGAAALAAGAPRAASEALDEALRLDPASEKARYNAGTAHLEASSEQAAPLLEAAAKSSDTTVASRAFYNLGNARLAAQDLQGAVDAYKESLRRDGANADAKFNLELALRRLAEQQKQNQQKQQNQDQQQQDQQKQDQQQQGQQQQDQQKQDQQQQDQQKQDQKPGQGEQKDQQQQPNQQSEEQQKSGDGKESGQPPQPQQNPAAGQKGESSPLPQFHDLPDMDANQAAAILEAIENLERSQRRQEAKKAQKANVRGKKDW